MNAFNQARRLRTKADFDYVFAQPKKIVSQYFVVLYRDNTVQHARLGLSISKKKVSKAHDRNRVKRIIRETFRTKSNLIAVDIVFLARSGLTRVANSTIKDNLEKQLDKLRVE